MQTLVDFLGIKNFIPHGFCLSWNPYLLWLHVVSDVLITLSYYSIPLSLLYFIRKRKDFPFKWLIIMGALFIVACGTTHLMSAIQIWIPLYWLDGYLKALTAIISVTTAIALLRIIPCALQLPSSSQLQNEINERKLAELERQEVSERLHKIANQLPSVVFQFRMRTDGSFCIPYANEALRTVYHLNPEEVRDDATAIFAVTHPDDLEHHIETIKNSARDLSPWHDEYRLKFADGTECWLLGDALPQREADGSTLWHGFVMDISERKRVDAERERLLRIIDDSADFVGMSDMQANLKYLNKAAKNMVGLPADTDIFKLKINDMHPEWAANRVLKEGIFTIHRDGFWKSENALLHRDGFEIPVSQILTIHRDESGKPQLISTIMRDTTETKRREQVLEESEARFRTLIERLPLALALADDAGNIIYTNACFKEIFGYSLDEIKTIEQWYLLAYPDENYRQHVIDKWHSAIECATTQKMSIEPTEYNVTCKNGEQRVVVISGIFLDNNLLATFTDVTKKKQAERALKANEERLYEIINLMPIAVFIKDRESKIVLMNRVCEAQWGVSCEQLKNTTGSHIFPSEQMAIFLEADEKIFVDHEIVELEESIWNAQLQANRIVHTYKKPIFNKAGMPEYLIGISVDLTDYKQQEHALKASEQRLNLSQEYGSIGSWEADLINNTQIWSATLFKLVELPVSENVTWKDFLALIHPDDRKMVIDANQAHLFRKEKYDVEYRVKLASGEIRWMRSIGRADFSFDGSPIRFIGIAQDISKRKEIEADLKRSNAELEQFAYAVSHDMRQPLRMITSYLSLIEMALATQLDDETRQFLHFAVDGAKRMDAMILSLLDYSRVGRLAKSSTIISTRAAIDEALLFLTTELKTSGGSVEISGDWIALMANGDELTRLFQNLISNALKYHDENKPPLVKVCASVMDSTFRVEVSDTGIGIAPNQIDRLFKVFSRLQARGRFDGTGVGLALCRKIVEHHDGRIGVESKGEGFGSLFWFEIPITNSDTIESTNENT